ncbi:MAG: amino acid permease [Nitrososphaerales archaeon]
MKGSSNETGLFVRNATGLVKNISGFGVFTWVIVNFPWLSSWSGIFWVTPSYYQNVNYYAGLAVWAVIAVIIVLLYWQLTVVMPRSGGDYVFVSRTIHPLVGFMAGLFFFVAYIVSAGSGPYWAFAEAGSHLSFSGSVLGNSWMANLGASITPFFAGSDKPLMFGVGLVLLAAGALAAIFAGRVLKTVVYGIFGYGIIVLIIVVVIFATHGSHSAFLQAYNQNAASFTNTTTGIFAQAAASGYTPGASLGNLFFIIPLLFVSIGPYPVMQTVGGEIKNPRKSLLYGLVGAELASIAVWFALTWLLDRVVGISFIEAWTIAPSAGAGFAPVPTIFATVLAPNPVLVWIIFSGLFVLNIGWGWLAFVFLSRVVMAWSFDRVLPERLSRVSTRFNTPTYAIALCAAIAIIPMYLEFFTSFLATQVNSIFILAVVWVLAAFSAIIYPFKRGDLYAFSDAKKSLFGVPLISILGMVGLVAFAYVGYASIANPAVGPFKEGAQIFLAAIVVFGVALFSASYIYRRKVNKIDLIMTFREIPPE